MEMDYNPIYDPDTLFYSCNLIYLFETVSTIVFEYKEVRFKIWSHFFNISTSDKLLLRFSVYNPVFLMPSLNSILVPLNLYPSYC